MARLWNFDFLLWGYYEKFGHMLKPFEPKFRPYLSARLKGFAEKTGPYLSARLKGFAEKQVPAKLKSIVGVRCILVC